MTDANLRILVELMTKGEGRLAGVENELKGLSSGVQQANDFLGQLGLGFSVAGLVAGIGAVGQASIQLAMDAEQTKIAFTNMLGSAQAADEFLGQLRDFAAATPFEFTELTEAARRMKALGFETEQVIPLLTAIGDAVAAMGGNAEMVDRVTLALGQMLSKGKVQAGEMLQLTEAGIPAWRYLAEAIGVSTAEVQKLSEKGLIPAEEAIAAIQAGMNNDFGGMMAQQADTAAGQLSMLADSAAQAGTQIGENFLPFINRAVPVLQGLTQTVADGVDAFFNLYKIESVLAVKAQESSGAISHQTAELRVQAIVAGDLVAGFVGVENEQQKVAEAHAATTEQLVRSSKTYEAYITGLVDAAVANGDLAEVERTNAETVAVLLDRYGNLTDKQIHAKFKAGELTAEQANLLYAFQTVGGEIAMTTGKLSLMSSAQYAAQKSVWALRDAEEAADKATADYNVRLQALAEKAQAAGGSLRSADEVMNNLRLTMAGAVDKEAKDFNESQSKLEESARKIREELEKLQAVEGQAYGPTADLASAQNNLALAQITSQESLDKLTKAQRDLAEYTGDDAKKHRDLQKALYEAQDAYDSSLGKIDDYKKKLDDADGGVVSHKTKIGELSQELKDAEAAIEENAQKHEEATRRIIFGIIEQKLAQNGLKGAHSEYTDEEAGFLDRLAQQWGLTGQMTGSAIQGIENALGEAVNSGDWETAEKRMNGVYQNAMGYIVPAGDAMRDAFNKAGGAIGDSALTADEIKERFEIMRGKTGELKDALDDMGGSIGNAGSKASELKSWIDKIQDKSVTFTVKTVYETYGTPPGGGGAGGIVPSDGSNGTPLSAELLAPMRPNANQTSTPFFGPQGLDLSQMPVRVYVLPDFLSAAMLAAEQRDELAQYADYLMA